MNIRGIVPLDEESLLSAAMRTTGLSDFGADDWREPFRILLRSMEEDADLNLVGRIRTRSEILQLLEARLQIEDTYKRFAQIDAERIEAPLIVIGQGRSGTSFLINLLMSDPENGAPLQWEAIFPCPPPQKATYTTDPRIERADKLIKQWIRVTPTLDSMHEFSARLPNEDSVIYALNFTSYPWFDAMGQVATYSTYMAAQSLEPALQYLKRVLKLLQWKNPRKHWVLKDCFYIDNLPAVMKVFPDARFVWPHRDPVRAFASVVSLIGTMQWGRCDQPFKGASFQYATDPALSASRLDRAIDQLQAGVVPPGQIYHMLYQDLVADPVKTVRAMYRHFGMTFTAAGELGLEKYLQTHPRVARPPHPVAMSGEAVAVARKAYVRYQDHFQIPSE